MRADLRPPDRSSLAARNTAMAKAFHQTSLREMVRRGLLVASAHIPIPTQRELPRERLLLIRPDHIGDLLLATPAIAHLRRARPAAEIHALVHPSSADVLANNPDVDQVLTLPFPGFLRGKDAEAYADAQRAPYTLALDTARHVRQVGYSAAFILRPDHWWGALVAKWAGIRTRIGYHQADVAPFLTPGYTLPHAAEHAVVQNMRLVQAFAPLPQPDAPRLRYTIAEADRLAMAEFFATSGIGADQRLIALQPGAGSPIKRWDARAWAWVADALAGELDATVVITGSAGERELAREITAHLHATTRAVLATGETTLGTLAALYARATLVLGADSGPMHLAVAVGTPTVTLYGPADPAEFGSWGDPARHAIVFSDIACRPCRILDWGTDDSAFHPCVRDITPARVLEAARRVLQSGESRVH